jgi:GalNAc-alpha-(1->4)-GalNAc-alpha-(1->3)-diNAcBac-PP-undecaprenol alpha-1,4-N-acetyl-D-galactosaminyltransferase
MRLTLIGAKLGCSGIEHVMATMTNYFAKKGWQVTYVILDDDSNMPFFELDPRVRLIPLGVYKPSTNLLEAIWNNLKRIKALRRAIGESKPDAVISFWTYVSVLVLFASRGLGVPVIVSEHRDPLTDQLKRLLDWLHRWVYTFADQVVVLTDRSKVCYPPRVQTRIRVIPNPLAPVGSSGGDTPRYHLAKPSLIAMGRLHRQKGFDLLLKAFWRLKDRYPAWTLTILGEGPSRPRLEAIRSELGLHDRVHLPGVVQNPHDLLKQADLFVMSSRWEGMPIALMEAMSIGLPVISTDCRTGPREIIRDGVDGILVPPEDVEALEAAMDRLMSDPEERKLMASRAVKVSERFSLDKVMGMWEELLMGVVPTSIGGG